jgi:hypothetical protein
LINFFNLSSICCSDCKEIKIPNEFGIKNYEEWNEQMDIFVKMFFNRKEEFLDVLKEMKNEEWKQSIKATQEILT